MLKFSLVVLVIFVTIFNISSISFKYRQISSSTKFHSFISNNQYLASLASLFAILIFIKKSLLLCPAIASSIFAQMLVQLFIICLDITNSFLSFNLLDSSIILRANLKDFSFMIFSFIKCLLSKNSTFQIPHFTFLAR